MNDLFDDCVTEVISVSRAVLTESEFTEEIGTKLSFAKSCTYLEKMCYCDVKNLARDKYKLTFKYSEIGKEDIEYDNLSKEEVIDTASTRYNVLSKDQETWYKDHT